MKRKYILMILLILSICILVYAIVDGKPFVDQTECVGCKDCTQVCPTNAITIQNERASIDPDLCIDCKFCVKTCTYRAIKTPK